MKEEDVELVQNKSPKVDTASMEPISWPKDPSQEWWVPACITVLCQTHFTASEPQLALLPGVQRYSEEALKGLFEKSGPKE